jgi:hypothetical protein
MAKVIIIICIFFLVFGCCSKGTNKDCFVGEVTDIFLCPSTSSKIIVEVVDQEGTKQFPLKFQNMGNRGIHIGSVLSVCFVKRNNCADYYTVHVIEYSKGERGEDEIATIKGS